MVQIFCSLHKIIPVIYYKNALQDISSWFSSFVEYYWRVAGTLKNFRPLIVLYLICTKQFTSFLYFAFDCGMIILPKAVFVYWFFCFVYKEKAREGVKTLAARKLQQSS